ncbi:MAG: zf-HC2 domain-containing protein [Bacteroidota bacterium]
MSIHETEEHLHDYLDGVLSVEQRHRVEAHLAECIRCRNEMKHLRILRDDVRELPSSLTPPRDLWPGISAQIEAEHSNILHHPASSAIGNMPRRRFGWTKRLTLAASVVIVIGGAFWASVLFTSPSWKVARLEGMPVIGSNLMDEIAELGVGDWLETDATSRAKLDVGTIGELEIEPNTRLRLIESKSSDHRIALAKGTIRATIWAPPRLFFVETPSATAIDLGCAYTLQVDDNGGGILKVTAGWVALELAGRSSIIPAGAQCETRPGIGPGTPYYDDATPRFKHAISEFDFASPSQTTLQILIDEARPKDAVTLFHLLSRTHAGDRVRIYNRLAVLAPPPKGVTCNGIIEGDKKMVQAWSEELGLDAHWWSM